MRETKSLASSRDGLGIVRKSFRRLKTARPLPCPETRRFEPEAQASGKLIRDKAALAIPENDAKAREPCRLTEPPA
jgi:hypothetical protein